ncbi:Hypothetical predicted protein [Mytilus galloprovincialis]|uniref:Caspase family p20 domain-containing protein n=1 Tax=Mytilus galloprovincialis TaxID=29158 RepID=A0A8B6H766_MYTGA|nr:Hypothetical predicted protein [Mytilus galloprovincialis]
MENKDMMDAVPYKKKTVITSESNCNTGLGKIAVEHLNQERYQIGSGIAVVINNTEFERSLNLPDRVGSDVDAASLFKGFQKLGFKSERLNNVSQEDMEKKFDDIKEDKKSLEETTSPKIFIIQACRGTGLGGGVEMEVDHR